MSLTSLANGWQRFGNGRIWRCIRPDWLVEVDREGNVPAYSLQSAVDKVRKVRSFYSGKVSLGILDSNGNGIDLITANAMAESLGSVPSSWNYQELLSLYKGSKLSHPGDRLNAILDTVKSKEKYLVRKEPGYTNPIATPGRVSVGSHHVLLSTALELMPSKSSDKKAAIEELSLKLPSMSSFAAELALKYFERSRSKHQLQPPLMAAIYNAGSLRPDASNAWNLRQYGEHIDRWVAYYNTSRLLSGRAAHRPTAPPISQQTLEVKVIRKKRSAQCTLGELYVNEQFHCYTLEDVVRTDGVKVYGETAIPAGRYKLAVTFSQRFQKRMPQILDVQQFEGVRIHAGNTSKDTLGCILVGKNQGENQIWDCKGVYNSLLKHLESFARKDRVYISITNQFVA